MTNRSCRDRIERPMNYSSNRIRSFWYIILWAILKTRFWPNTVTHIKYTISKPNLVYEHAAASYIRTKFTTYTQNTPLLY